MRFVQIFLNEMPASNERFCEMAAVIPQTILWEIARYYPAASVVEAATSKTLAASGGDSAADNEVEN